MPVIVAPKRFEAEKSYVIGQLFTRFLRMDYKLKFDESALHYTLHFSKGRQIILSDAFFANIEDNYLDIKNIPQDIKKLNLPEISENALDILYGNAELKFDNNLIFCGVDIFASVFFMLSRWEELATTERDKYGRFSAESSLAYKAGFLQRPIVNQYVDLLVYLFKKLDIKYNYARQEAMILPTHDVDLLQKYRSTFHALGKTAKRIFRSDFDSAKAVWSEYSSIRKRKMSDPYNVFDYFLIQSSLHNLTPFFFFLVDGGGRLNPSNNLSNKFARNLFQKLDLNDAKIGLHASYGAVNKPGRIGEERLKLEQLTKSRIVSNRQHFLQTPVDKLVVELEKARISHDFSIAYASQPGFRAGTCYPYQLFNFETRTTTGIIEIPTCLMDTTLVEYMQLPVAEAQLLSTRLQIEVKKHKGVFCFLWHNSNINSDLYSSYKQVFESLFHFPER